MVILPGLALHASSPPVYSVLDIVSSFLDGVALVVQYLLGRLFFLSLPFCFWTLGTDKLLVHWVWVFPQNVFLCSL